MDRVTILLCLYCIISSAVTYDYDYGGDDGGDNVDDFDCREPKEIDTVHDYGQDNNMGDNYNGGDANNDDAYYQYNYDFEPYSNYDNRELTDYSDFGMEYYDFGALEEEAENTASVFAGHDDLNASETSTESSPSFKLTNAIGGNTDDATQLSNNEHGPASMTDPNSASDISSMEHSSAPNPLENDISDTTPLANDISATTPPASDISATTPLKAASSHQMLMYGFLVTCHITERYF